MEQYMNRITEGNIEALAEMEYVRPHLEELVRLINAGVADKTKDEALLTISQIDKCQAVIRVIWPANSNAFDSIKNRSGDFARLTDHYIALGVFA